MEAQVNNDYTKAELLAILFEPSLIELKTQIRLRDRDQEQLNKWPEYAKDGLSLNFFLYCE